jgi:hypothetical protein
VRVFQSWISRGQIHDATLEVGDKCRPAGRLVHRNTAVGVPEIILDVVIIYQLMVNWTEEA